MLNSDVTMRVTDLSDNSGQHRSFDRENSVTVRMVDEKSYNEGDEGHGAEILVGAGISHAEAERLHIGDRFIVSFVLITDEDEYPPHE